MAGFCFVTGGIDPNEVVIDTSNYKITFLINADDFLNTVGACKAWNSALCKLVSDKTNIVNINI